ncbi:glycosyltransferase family 4 protein [Paenibacillus aurantiacus]|uniref:Glycosyltransferase family 4 protein n=1 Tax=Paenibacillus aurantiacus TaxID=1936118 RepID=A0ABV5KNZ6_9BACL
MRLLMLSWRGPHHPRAGGAEVYTEQLLEGLVQRGHEVSWYSAAHERDMPQVYKGIRLLYGAEGMKVYITGNRFTRKSTDFDVIIDQINTFGFLTPWSAKTKHVSLIHQLADDVWDYETKPPVSQIGKFLEKQLLAKYRKTPYITISQSTQEDLVRLGWEGAHAIVSNGVEVGMPTEKSANPSIVFLARFKAQAKRLDHAFRAFLEVQKKYPEAEFWVIGRGDPPEYLKDKRGVKVYNNTSDHERDLLLAQAWLCIATSVREGWGRMVLESAAYGTASVVYNVPGLRDAVVHNETGLVVNPNVDDMHQAITFLFDNPDKLREYSANAYAKAKEYTWESSIDRMENFLTDVLTLS